jgi:hypothetical protein
MANRKKDPSAVLGAKVEARISAPEKQALDRLIAERAAALAADGITGQDTFSAWLRSAIREKAKAAGYPVQDIATPSTAQNQKAGKPARKAK